MALGVIALKYARQELGKQEIPKGSNWGPDVQKYLNAAGYNFPTSWCMALMYWCFDQAAKEVGVPNPMFKTGGVLLQWEKRRLLYAVKDPQPGDVFILNYGGGKGHTGMIEALPDPAPGKKPTIEGNSNDDGSREGYEVVRHARSVDHMYGILRF